MTRDADFARDLAAGARNLLLNCAGLTPTSRLLIVHERPDLGWHDREAPMAVAAEARRLGATPHMLEVGPPSNDRDPRIEAAIAAHDVIVFFARIGDQDRFTAPDPDKTWVMSYARDAGMLASAFGRTDHRALLRLKGAVNDLLLGAERIDLSCALGTRLSGALSPEARASRRDVGIRRFPMGVPQPIDAAGFSGRVALAHYLTPTGSRVYDPAFLKVERVVMAEVTAGRVTGFSGDPEDAARVRLHHRAVAACFGIDADAIHSWHAGIHPGCDYRAEAAQNPDRWSNTAFANPRLLHFHTCGAYAPGEICWMVLDPTIRIDGAALWDRGRLRAEAFAPTRACLDAWPALAALLADPAPRVGLPA